MLWGESPARCGRKGISTSHPCPLPDGSISTWTATFLKQRGKTQAGCSPTGWGQERGERHFPTRCSSLHPRAIPSITETIKTFLSS